jgi:hypothetical protein
MTKVIDMGSMPAHSEAIVTGAPPAYNQYVGCHVWKGEEWTAWNYRVGDTLKLYSVLGWTVRPVCCHCHC